MSPASQFGPEYMTYVLWAITPEGRPMNLGEVVLEGDHAKLLSTTDLQVVRLDRDRRAVLRSDPAQRRRGG